MHTLVLNAGYEPMSIVSYKRAVILVLTGKATVLASDPTARVRSAALDVASPTVVLLRRYVRPPSGRSVALSRRGVLRRDDWACAYCGGRANTVDHVLPRSRGGGNSWANLVACCRACNSAKGSRTPEEMGWRLRVVPKAPRASRYWLRDVDSPAPDWLPYLEAAGA